MYIMYVYLPSDLELGRTSECARFICDYYPYQMFNIKYPNESVLLIPGTEDDE